MIESITQFFTKLPATSQAAIIAAFVTLGGAIFAGTITFIGVLMTHRGNERRFAKQLEHDREQKRTEREMALRKQVYLDAAEAIVAGLGIITRYIDLTVPEKELVKEFEEKRSAIVKIHLIAKQETVSAILNFTAELGAEIMRLAILRQALMQKQASIKTCAEFIQSCERERDRMVELTKQLNFRGDTDQHRWEFIRTTYEAEQKKIAEAIAGKTALEDRLKMELRIFIVECFSGSGKVGKLIVPAVKSARDELSLPFDDYDEYKVMIEKSFQQQIDMIAKAMSGSQTPTGKTS